MRYIKLFEQHSSTLEENINAALIELEDMGFTLQKRFYLTSDYQTQQVVIRILKLDLDNKMMSYKYGEIDDIVMTLIDYLEEIWGFVSTEWRVYGYYKRSDPNWKTKAINRSSKPTNDTSVLDVDIQLREVKFPIKTSDVRAYEGMYYSDEMKETISDILINLKDDGFKYFFNDVRNGLTITLEKGDYLNSKKTFKKSDIIEPFLMLEDYMREEWGDDINISYEYHSIGAGTGHVNIYGRDYATKVNTINDIKTEKLVKLKFICSKY